MATTFTVHLIGGPCDGETRQLPSSQIHNVQLWCKGVHYVFDALLQTPKLAYPLVPASDLSSSTQGVSPQHVTQAWTRWMHILAHKGPASHRRILGATAQVNRIARKR